MLLLLLIVLISSDAAGAPAVDSAVQTLPANANQSIRCCSTI